MFDTLRPLVRIAKALERLADVGEAQLKLAQDEWTATHSPRPRSKEPFVMDTMDPAAADEFYKKSLAERGYDMREMEDEG
jgi:uncharacterized protein YqcC (DUF446 family)